MSGALRIERFDDVSDWVFSPDRTRAATWRDTRHPSDVHGTGTDLFIEVWDAVKKQRLWTDWRVNRDDDDTGIAALAFSADGRALIVRYTDGTEDRATFPFHPNEARVITIFIEAVRGGLTDAQIARLEAIDTSDTGGFHDLDFAFFLADVLCRRLAPLALEASGHHDLAAQLRALTPIENVESATAARMAMESHGTHAPPVDDILREATASAACIVSDDSNDHMRADELARRAGDMIGVAQRSVGDDITISDTVIEIVADLAALTRKPPRVEGIESVLEGIGDPQLLTELASDSPVEHVRRLADQRLRELGPELRKSEQESQERAARFRSAQAERASKFATFEDRIRELQREGDAGTHPPEPPAATPWYIALGTIIRRLMPGQK